MTFGTRIRELRQQQHLTQRELATLLGVDFSYISKIENDRLDQPPSEDLIRRFAGIVDTDADALLDLAGRFDADLLRDAITQQPEIGVIVRRLQRGHVSREQIERILTIVGRTS